ncbi:MAG: hypothetical protein ACLSHR_13530 [Oscillospiraceae bacterium]|jgi:hypothetical protein
MSSDYKKTQNIFPHPMCEDLKKLTAKSCIGIADQVETNTASNDDFGNYTREVVIVILKELANSMSPGESLDECFRRIKQWNLMQ